MGKIKENPEAETSGYPTLSCLTDKALIGVDLANSPDKTGTVKIAGKSGGIVYEAI